jgi:UTP--glucose-1-phosphate uridylyltransferase
MRIGYLQATVVFGQRHPEVGAAFTQYLKGM